MLKKAVGIDIGGTNTNVSLIDETGRILRQFKFRTPKGLSASSVVEKIFLGISESGVFKESSRVGCGVAALIHPSTGYVDFAPNLGWRNFNLKKSLPEGIGIKKIVFENDANCAAVGIYKRMKKKVHSLAVITLGTGIGGGLIIDGKLFSNPDISAFEVGHTTVDPHGIKCACGSRGCLETFCGARYMNKWASKYWAGTKFEGKILTPHEIADYARAGKNWAKKVWLKYGEYLAVGVSNLVNLLALDEVVFTGGIAAGFPFFRESVKKEVAKRTLSPYVKKVRISRASWNSYIGSIGAAFLVLNNEDGS